MTTFTPPQAAAALVARRLRLDPCSEPIGSLRWTEHAGGLLDDEDINYPEATIVDGVEVNHVDHDEWRTDFWQTLEDIAAQFYAPDDWDDIALPNLFQTLQKNHPTTWEGYHSGGGIMGIQLIVGDQWTGDTDTDQFRHYFIGAADYPATGMEVSRFEGTHIESVEFKTEIRFPRQDMTELAAEIWAKVMEIDERIVAEGMPDESDTESAGNRAGVDEPELVCDDCLSYWGAQVGHVYEVVEVIDCPQAPCRGALLP